MSLKILVVDDDEVTRKLLKEVLEKQGYSICLAASGEEAVRLSRVEKFPIILSDIRMYETNGMDVLRTMKKYQAQSAVILMTGFGSMEGAIEAIQEGAFDYVSKPFKMDSLRNVVLRAAKHWESLHSGSTLRADFPSQIELATRTLIGKSPQIVEVYKTLARAGLSNSTVLIVGESGTGKELVARAIHRNSQRRNRRFLAVNCGALAENLLESELFGHVKGAFTGAISEKKGLFEEAHEGTLFLDEIGDISAALQIKLLRVLQEQELKPVGAAESRHVNVRLIAATHRDLENLIRQGKFREDLYYRLRVISIDLPPLRDRMEDLSELVEHFLAKFADKNKKAVSHISDEAMNYLRRYHWPGNIRELEHAIERAVAMTNTAVLFPEDFPSEVLRSGASDLAASSSDSSEIYSGVHQEVRQDLNLGIRMKSTSLEELEKTHILKVLQEVHYNKSKASEILGIDRATLYRKAQRYRIELRGK